MATQALVALARVLSRLWPAFTLRTQLRAEALSRADRINAPEALAPYIARLSSTDKTLRIYPGSLHEPHNDLDRLQVVADVAEWIERTAGAR